TQLADVSMTATTLVLTTPGATETDTLATIDKVLVNGSTAAAGAFTAFTGQVVFTSGVPQWVEQGGGPVTGSNSRTGGDTPAERITSGSVQAIAVDPTDSKVMYVGATNGGLWKTTDGGLSWKPLSDQFRSLSISTIAIDKTPAAVDANAHKVIY